MIQSETLQHVSPGAVGGHPGPRYPPTMSGNVVFISYAHESDELRVRVLDLAGALLRAGWDVRLDRYVGHPDEEWPRWMANQIEEADRILCICTPTYRERVEGNQARGGLGVSWEGYLLSGMLYRLQSRRRNVIAVWPAGKSIDEGVEYVPTVLRPLDGLPFDEFAIVERLGVVGEPRGEPVHKDGWSKQGAMDGNLILGQLYEPIRPRRSGDPNDVVPSTFFRPVHAVVPFQGRDSHLRDLDDWCLGDGLSVRAMYGPGGAGKTRLALELAARRAAEGWRAGPLVREQVTPERVDRAVTDPIPLLVVVDYAEAHAKETRVLLTAALAKSNGTLRVLLLCRHLGEWLDVLCVNVRGLRDVLEPALEVRDGEPGTVALAAAAFADRLGLHPPADLPEDAGTTLDRHVAGYLAVIRASEFGILGLVEHEQRYLRQVATDVGLPAPVVDVLPDAVALATLAQGIPGDAYRSWLKLVPGLDDQPNAVVKLVGRVLKEVYPAADGGVAPVRPDRVGEVYVAAVDRDGEIAALAVDRGRAREALTVLTRLAQRGGTEGPLRGLLASRWRTLGEPTVEVAIATGDPIGRLTAELLEAAGDVAWARGVVERLPMDTVALRELAEVVMRLLVAEVEDGDDAAFAWRAAHLNDLSNRLSELGRREEALAVAENAAELWRRLAFARPPASDAGLAMSLGNLGIKLSEVGRQEEALAPTIEAADLYRRLAESRPDAFLPDLAKTLINLGNRLSALGRWEDALAATNEGTGLCRRLAEAQPIAFLPVLALGLTNLGCAFEDLGRSEEALAATQEAAGLYRLLAESRPDAFLTSLAASLSNLGMMLSALGRPDEALSPTSEAVDLRRRLASSRPDAFVPGLAASLTNLGNRLSDLGRPEDALAATQEAAGLHRRLAESHPGAFLPHLATSLNNLGTNLSALGRWDEALTSTSEAVDIRRRLAESRPDVFLGVLAASLSNLSSRLSEVGRREEALAQVDEAIALYRRLAVDRPAAVLPALATSLWGRGHVLRGLGRETDAAASYREGLVMLRPFAKRLPQVHGDSAKRLAVAYHVACQSAAIEPDHALLAQVAEALGHAPKS